MHKLWICDKSVRQYVMEKVCLTAGEENSNPG